MSRSLENRSLSPTIVITYGWALGTPGGVARHLQELSRHLAQAGAKVILVCVSAAGYSGFPRQKLREDYEGREVEAELAELGVELVRVAPDALHWTRDGLRVKKAVEQLLDARSIDVVLGFYNEAAHLPDLCAERGVPFGYIATWLSYRMALNKRRQGTGLRGLFMRRVNRRFVIEPYRKAQVLFANSEFTRRELVEVVGCDANRIRITYLGVSPFFADIPRARPERIERFVFFGRLVPEKGIADAISALGKLHAHGITKWTFRIMGSGNHEHVRGLAQRAGIAERIELTDHQGDAVLREELARAQLAILPSHSESFGLSIAEAQAAGLPVVAYYAGSVPEVVEDGETAWLPPCRDDTALYLALREAVEDPEVTWRRGLAGRERIARLFSWEKTAQRVLDGVRELGDDAWRQSA